MRAADITNAGIRETQRGMIRDFISDHADLLGGKVLDYGCGDSPYRDLVPGEYVGWNRARYPGTPYRTDLGPDEPLLSTWNAILCTQMLQYVPDPQGLLFAFHASLQSCRGYLVLTIQTTWPEVEVEDLWRFTSYGITELLHRTAFTALTIRQLGSITFANDGFSLPLGWGVTARATARGT